MNIVDEILDKAKYVVGKTGEKTGKIVEISRLKLNCVTINSDIEREYQKLGKIVYDVVKSGVNDEAAIFGCVDRIGELMNELAEISSKISDDKNCAYCPGCGTMNMAGANFCCQCGRPIPQPEKKEECCCDSEPCSEPAEEACACAEAPCEACPEEAPAVDGEPCCCGEEKACCEEEPCAEQAPSEEEPEEPKAE